MEQTKGTFYVNGKLGSFSTLLEQALDSKQPFDQQPVAKLTPFIEQMGTGESSATRPRYQKEFWWEREW
jgi:hypothetical protein